LGRCPSLASLSRLLNERIDVDSIETADDSSQHLAQEYHDQRRICAARSIRLTVSLVLFLEERAQGPEQRVDEHHATPLGLDQASERILAGAVHVQLEFLITPLALDLITWPVTSTVAGSGSDGWIDAIEPLLMRGDLAHRREHRG
jgi:hypothetical protein